ncbi:MAG TPA: TAT-variant-translocated molybdopterin oxidoreductase, partial [Kofleriaceae bacterium]|nr:TAT-variant-translocated molybdopterin oxidoreductase [Kofleriaceae bacterium]
MSAKDHDHDHDHHHHDEPSAPLPATPEHGYWKSLRELAGQAPWQLAPSTREFPPGADQPPPVDPMSRRNFFHLMGASMGLAGLGVASGCQRYEKEEIVPLARRPEDQTPSQTLQYATAFELGGVGHALLATSYEGRPIHLDGNPDHPFASGPIVPNTKAHAGAHTFAQASILHLYDPDRAQTVMRGSNATSMDAFKASLVDLRKAIAAGGAYVLSEATSSPTVQALRGKLGGSVRWHEYEPISWDNERAGTKLAFGKPYRPLARLDKCSTIVTLDCDIFVEHPAAMRYCRDYARGRRKDGTLVGNLNRMYSIESVFSNTGALADHRLALRSEFGLPFAMALDAALGGGSVAPASDFLKEDKVARFVAALVDELRRNKGKAVVIAGRRQPPEVHALVARINDLIGAVGKTLDYLEDPDPDRPSHLQAITALVQDMAQHKVQTLLILGGNPVYDAPADLDFASALGNVQTSVHLAEYPDETSAKCTWHVPRAHFLEAWGDVRSWDGTITLQQPLIAPLYGGLSTAEFLSALAGDELGGQQLVRQTHEAMHIGSWRQNVHDGYIANTALPIATPALAALPQFQPSPSQSSGSKRKNGELEVVFHYSSASYDGRFA